MRMHPLVSTTVRKPANPLSLLFHAFELLALDSESTSGSYRFLQLVHFVTFTVGCLYNGVQTQYHVQLLIVRKLPSRGTCMIDVPKSEEGLPPGFLVMTSVLRQEHIMMHPTYQASFLLP